MFGHGNYAIVEVEKNPHRIDRAITVIEYCTEVKDFKEFVKTEKQNAGCYFDIMKYV
jgi:hypothetical protein